MESGFLTNQISVSVFVSELDCSPSPVLVDCPLPSVVASSCSSCTMVPPSDASSTACSDVAGVVSSCSSCTMVPPSSVSSAAHAGAGRSVRHSASAMSTLNIRFFMSFLLEKSSCFYVEIRHLSDDVFTGCPALNAASSRRSWPPPGASRPACRGCG